MPWPWVVLRLPVVSYCEITRIIWRGQEVWIPPLWLSRSVWAESDRWNKTTTKISCHKLQPFKFHHRPRFTVQFFHHRPFPTWCTHFQPWLIRSDCGRSFFPLSSFYLTTILSDCPKDLKHPSCAKWVMS